MIHAFKWTDHGSDINNELQYLFDNSVACDCFLISSEGKRIGAHQLILSTVSVFFRQILAEQPLHIEPLIHIPDADINVLNALLAFVYKGETSIASDQFFRLLELGNILHIKGFPKHSDMNDRGEPNSSSELIVPFDAETDITEDTPELDEPFVECGGGDTHYDIEYLDEDDAITIKDESIQLDSADELDVTELLTYDVEQADDETPDPTNTAPKGELHPTSHSYARTTSNAARHSTLSRIDQALNEVKKSDKTLSRLSIEYNVPRSTLYHRFRNDESLRKNYRVDHKAALEQAVNVVLDENVSLSQASERFNVSKTAVWRAVRKCEQYNPTAGKDLPAKRQKAQKEIMAGKSLKSLSDKYGIPLTTLHRDKKKLSKEGKLPEKLRVRDRSEKSEFNQRLELALESCRQGMSQYQAAGLFKIPKATMWRYAHALVRNEQKTKPEATKQNEAKDKKDKSNS